jgi:hypothetical protein
MQTPTFCCKKSGTKQHCSEYSIVKKSLNQKSVQEPIRMTAGFAAAIS